VDVLDQRRAPSISKGRLIRLWCLISLALLGICAQGCDPDDSRGAPWDVENPPDVERADSDAERDDVGPDADDTDTVPDTDATEPDYPSFFIDCQPEEAGPPAERVYRDNVPTSYTLELEWSAAPKLEKFDEVFEATRISAPSSSVTPPRQPTVLVTAQTTDDDVKTGRWETDTSNGNVLSRGALSASGELFRSTAAMPAVRALSGQATWVGILSSSATSRRARLHLDWDFAPERGFISRGYSIEDIPRSSEKVVGRLGLFPQGRTVVRWGHRWLIGLNPELFRAQESFPFGYRRLWWATGSDLWPGADEPEIRWTAGPRPGEVATLVEDSDGDERWVEVDRCGVSREIYTASNLTRDLAWMGDAYLLLRDDGRHPGGATPVRAIDGDVLAEADFGCRNIVERQTDEWACSRQSQTGYEVVTFDENLEELDRFPIPTDESVTWQRARLHAAGKGGALVFAGIVSDGSEVKYAVASRVGSESKLTVVEPAPGDTQPARADSIHTGILGSDGVFVFSTDEAVYAVQTHIEGLSKTRFPRAIYGGNEARGYVAVD
jgi:hypothetical protein